MKNLKEIYQANQDIFEIEHWKEILYNFFKENGFEELTKNYSFSKKKSTFDNYILVRDCLCEFLIILKNKDLSLDDIDTLENLINTCFPFGKLFRSCYFSDEKSSINPVFFSYASEMLLKQLVILTFCKKLFDKGFELFLKYKNAFGWDAVTLTTATKEAKIVWDKTTPDQYQNILFEYFNNLSLNKLYLLKSVLEEYSPIFKDNQTDKKCIFILEKISQIIKDSNCKFYNDFINELNNIKCLQDAINLINDQSFKTLKDTYKLFNQFSSQEQNKLTSLFQLFDIEFSSLTKNLNYFYEVDFISQTLNEIIDKKINYQFKKIQDLGDNLSNQDKIDLIKQFFLSAKNIEEYKNDIYYKFFINTIEENLQNYIEKIKDNQTIFNCLASSQKLINENLNNDTSLVADYSIFVLSQIKLVERYLKEVLVQFYPDQIYSLKPFEGERKINFKKDNFKNLSALDLSQKSNFFVCEKSNKPYNILELGPTALALQKIYCKNKDYNGIFSPSDNHLPSTNTPFQNNFINKVRNGFFHIHIIDNIKEAISLSQKTAYWFLKCIDEAPDKIR